MLKSAASFVLDLEASSAYPRGYASGASFVCGRAGRPFWTPAMLVSTTRTALAKLLERAGRDSILNPV